MQQIEVLENRLRELEYLVFGVNKPVKHVPSEQEKNLVDQLYTLYSGLSAAEKRPVSGKLLSRVNEIQKYTDPNFMEDDVLLTKSKIEIILARKWSIPYDFDSFFGIKRYFIFPSFKHLVDIIGAGVRG
ncbi:unnamed protein product [Trichobilharzia regenti]|nr:unnamed protein product [Trichobilharzia regenti]